MPINPSYSNATVSFNGTNWIVPHIAEAILTSTNMTGGSGPDSSIYPPGFVTGLCPHHHQRGHLIGKQLGGSGRDPRNLVTLTEGSNHPFMYEYELLVYNHVKNNPNVNFTYRVTAQYDINKYYAAPPAPGGATAGALSNPYCPPPCPESLVIYFYYINASNQTVYPLVVSSFDQNGYQQDYQGPVTIQNGGYKFHEGSVTHVKNNCWAA